MPGEEKGLPGANRAYGPFSVTACRERIVGLLLASGGHALSCCAYRSSLLRHAT